MCHTHVQHLTGSVKVESVTVNQPSVATLPGQVNFQIHVAQKTR